MKWPDIRDLLRGPGNPVMFEFEASSVDLFFVLFLVFIKEFFGFVEFVEFVSVAAATSGSSDQCY